MRTETATITEFFGDVISMYSRSDAISDGVLVPISPTLCNEAGIKFPVAVTDTIWNGYIDPSNISQLPGQSVDGRLWDLHHLSGTSPADIPFPFLLVFSACLGGIFY